MIVSTMTGAISGKGIRHIMGLGKGAVVLVVIVGMLVYSRLRSSAFMGQTTSRLFLCLFQRRVVLG